MRWLAVSRAPGGHPEQLDEAGEVLLAAAVAGSFLDTMIRDRRSHP